MVPLSDIAGNGYNLNIPRYIDGGEPEDLHDLTAHLQGGIPARDVDALQDYWQVFPPCATCCLPTIAPATVGRR
jgi:type I restriction enzyme M protein